MERILGRELSGQEKAVAISAIVGIIVAMFTREYLHDVMLDHREFLTRTRTKRREVSTNVQKQELLTEPKSDDEGDGTCEERTADNDESSIDVPIYQGE